MFKPFTKKYDFRDDVLIESFPAYLAKPVANWIMRNLKRHNKRKNNYPYTITSTYIDKLQVNLREEFSDEPEHFIDKLFSDTELLTNYLAYVLQNHSSRVEAVDLENILSVGGSAYEVDIVSEQVDQRTTRYSMNLAMRVPEVAKKQASKALTENEQLAEAWQKCYQHNPDYEKVVSVCCDVLEGLFQKKYWPKDLKPQIGKFVNQFQQSPEVLDYDGNSIVDPSNNLTDLLQNIANIRGQHKNGQGRSPTAEEARFVLHITITIWNLTPNI